MSINYVNRLYKKVGVKPQYLYRAWYYDIPKQQKFIKNDFFEKEYFIQFIQTTKAHKDLDCGTEEVKKKEMLNEFQQLVLIRILSEEYPIRIMKGSDGWWFNAGYPACEGKTFKEALAHLVCSKWDKLNAGIKEDIKELLIYNS